MRIIGFNGPPRSGKDTLAKAIHEIHDDEVRFIANTTQYSKWAGDWGRPEQIMSEALIMPCRLAAFALLGMGAYDHELYERVKDQPIEHLRGVTLRQFMIRLSEDHLKKTYGRGFYGNALKAKLLNQSKVMVYLNEILLLVTDIGFQEEVNILSDLVCESNFLLVKVRRERTSFAGDSRGWCSGANTYFCENNQTPRRGAYSIMTHAHEVLGWEF